MTKTVVVTGASGFIGSHLAQALAKQGYDVRAMTRTPERYQGAGLPIFGDVIEPDSLADALEGAHAAYYLVHSLESEDFEADDAVAASNFGAAAADAGLERLIYLGGLGKDDGSLSAHLRSRREVERLLAGAGVPVTALRAAVVIGHGGISWEITRQLVAHLPVMLTPRWIKTRTQPIALRDVIRYLIGVLEPEQAKGRIFEIGGPEVMRYVDMLQRAAAVQGRNLLNVSVPMNVPVLTTTVSAAWLALLTDVNMTTARNLIDSMSNEVIVRDTSITAVVPGECISYEKAVRYALAERARVHTR